MCSTLFASRVYPSPLAKLRYACGVTHVPAFVGATCAQKTKRTNQTKKKKKGKRRKRGEKEEVSFFGLCPSTMKTHRLTSTMKMSSDSRNILRSSHTLFTQVFETWSNNSNAAQKKKKFTNVCANTSDQKCENFVCFLRRTRRRSGLGRGQLTFPGKKKHRGPFCFIFLRFLVRYSVTGGAMSLLHYCISCYLRLSPDPHRSIHNYAREGHVCKGG